VLLGVRVIFLHRMTSSVRHSRERRSVPRCRWPGPQSGILDKSLDAACGQS
jgi:hypothetical protein